MKKDPEQKLKFIYIPIEICDTGLYDYLSENYVKLNNN